RDPQARALCLGRDRRGMIASALATNARRGDMRFGRIEGDTDERFVRRFRRFAVNLAASWQRRSDRSHLVRYEDLLQRPRETIEELVAYLGLEASARELEQMAESLGRREQALEAHITSGSPAA